MSEQLDSRPKILVVDDDKRHLAIVSALLESEGFAVATAENARQAVAQQADWRPALIIMDIMMPEFDGFQATWGFRQLNESLPILVLSAKTAPEDMADGRDWGATRYMTKPFDPDELIATVRELLANPGT
ncbi:MAG: response regulator transcription factor [bacterium]